MILWGLGYLAASCLLALGIARFMRVGQGPRQD